MNRCPRDFRAEADASVCVSTLRRVPLRSLSHEPLPSEVRVGNHPGLDVAGETLERDPEADPRRVVRVHLGGWWNTRSLARRR